MPASFYMNRRKGKKYEIEEQLSNFESIDDAINESLIRQKFLYDSELDEDHLIANDLESCIENVDRVCNSTACPIDVRLFRQWLCAELIELALQHECLQLLTLLFYDEMMTDKELNRCDFKKLKERLWRQLKRAGFENPVIGTLEFDYHTECGLWLPHFHLIVMDDRPAVEKLRAYFKKQKRPGYTSTISRPFYVRDIHSKAGAFSYVCKLYSMSVVPYLNGQGERRTKKYRLKDKQLRLSLRVCDRLGFSGLLFLYGVRRVGNELRVTSVSDK